MGISIDEKRVYDASEGPTPVYVAGEFGVARVDTSDDLVGEFGLSRRCSARDAAGRDGRIAVATDEDVLVGTATGGEAETEFEPLGVGPAVAVGFAGNERAEEDEFAEKNDRTEDKLVVASEDGAVVRGDGENWTELGDLADVRALNGDLVAAESGVYKVVGEDLRHVGLTDARDVSVAGVPLTATGGGLYKLGNGWMEELAGDFRAVSAARGDTEENTNAGTLGWAHAAGADGLFAHGGNEQSETNGEWREVDLPVDGEVVAVDHGGSDVGRENDGPAAAYAATADGTFLLSVGDSWNHQILGLRGVRAVAAP